MANGRLFFRFSVPPVHPCCMVVNRYCSDLIFVFFSLATAIRGTYSPSKRNKCMIRGEREDEQKFCRKNRGPRQKKKKSNCSVGLNKVTKNTFAVPSLLLFFLDCSGLTMSGSSLAGSKMTGILAALISSSVIMEG